jgi:hypothetical protein
LHGISGEEHQNSDWLGIHEKICQSLIPLRVPQPFLPSEEERRRRDVEIVKKKVKKISNPVNEMNCVKDVVFCLRIDGTY